MAEIVKLVSNSNERREIIPAGSQIEIRDPRGEPIVLVCDEAVEIIVRRKSQ